MLMVVINAIIGGHFGNIWYGSLQENRGQRLEYVLLCPKVNFCLKVAQIQDLSTEIQGFEASARRPLTLESRTTNNDFKLL